MIGEDCLCLQIRRKLSPRFLAITLSAIYEANRIPIMKNGEKRGLEGVGKRKNASSVDLYVYE